MVSHRVDPLTDPHGVSSNVKGDQLLFEYANKYHPTDYVKVSVSSARPNTPVGRPFGEFGTPRNWSGWGGGGVPWNK